MAFLYYVSITPYHEPNPNLSNPTPEAFAMTFTLILKPFPTITKTHGQLYSLTLFPQPEPLPTLTLYHNLSPIESYSITLALRYIPNPFPYTIALILYCPLNPFPSFKPISIP